MKILQLGKFYPIFGGVEKVEWDIAKGVSSRGVSCDMLCCGLRRELHSSAWEQYKGRWPMEIRFNGHGCCMVVPAIMKVASTMISPALIVRLRRIRKEYDVIHMHHPDPMAALALLLSGFRGKVVLHWHSDVVRQKSMLMLFMPILKWLIRRADIIVGTTPVYVAGSPMLASLQDKIRVIPIGIKPVEPDEEGAALIRARYPGCRLVYSLGRLVEYKGYEYLIEAAAHLPDDYHILIGGDGPLREALGRKIARMGLEDKVTLLGYIDSGDFAAYYTACDVFALSSIYKTEAFAIVQIEAMSCGKPVIATRIEGSGVSWVNRDGYSGINVPPMDARALADAVVRVTGDKTEYAEFCIHAREHYSELFTAKRMIDDCINLYKSLTDEAES